MQNRNKQHYMRNVIIVSLLLSCPQLSHCDNIVQKCDNALTACQKVVIAQDAAIEHLKQQVKDTTDKLIEAERQPLIPTWVWITLGLTAGGVIGYAVHR